MVLQDWQREWHWTTEHNARWSARKFVEAPMEESRKHEPEHRSWITVYRQDGSSSKQIVGDVNTVWWDQDDGSTILEIVVTPFSPTCTVEGCDLTPSRRRKDGRCQSCVKAGRK